MARVSVVPTAGDDRAAPTWATGPCPRYSDHLALLIAQRPGRTKGERTRALLKYGAVRVLDDVGYRAMRVSDICEVAGVAAATFYLYFENKEAITRGVLAEYIDAAMTMMIAPRDGDASAFAAIRAAHLRWIEVTCANAGLTRCILQLGDEAADFRDLVNAANRRWSELVAQAVLRDQSDSAAYRDTALFAAYALGGMMDELARKLVIHPDPALVALQERTAPTYEELADFLAVVWYRALYGASPRERPTSDAARSLMSLGQPSSRGDRP